MVVYRESLAIQLKISCSFPAIAFPLASYNHWLDKGLLGYLHHYCSQLFSQNSTAPCFWQITWRIQTSQMDLFKICLKYRTIQCVNHKLYRVRQHFSWDSKDGVDAVFTERTVLQVAIRKSEIFCFIITYFPIFLSLNLMLFFFLHIDWQRYIILQLLALELPKSQVHPFLLLELWL